MAAGSKSGAKRLRAQKATEVGAHAPLDPSFERLPELHPTVAPQFPTNGPPIDLPALLTSFGANYHAGGAMEDIAKINRLTASMILASQDICRLVEELPARRDAVSSPADWSVIRPTFERVMQSVEDAFVAAQSAPAELSDWAGWIARAHSVVEKLRESVDACGGDDLVARGVILARSTDMLRDLAGTFDQQNAATHPRERMLIGDMRRQARDLLTWRAMHAPEVVIPADLKPLARRLNHLWRSKDALTAEALPATMKAGFDGLGEVIDWRDFKVLPDHEGGVLDLLATADRQLPATLAEDAGEVNNLFHAIGLIAGTKTVPLASAPSVPPIAKPVWKNEVRELWFEGKILKAFPTSATRLMRIIKEFHVVSPSWPNSVSNPFPTRNKLSRAVSELNAQLDDGPILFALDSVENAVQWRAK